MFSRGNHDDQKALAQVLAPLTYQIPQLSAGVYLSSPIDLLSAHYFHLESLLDSTLATLTLIHDSAPTTALPALTGHTTEVLRALCRHAFVQAPSPIAPTATPIPSPFPSPLLPATYAQAVTGTATAPVLSADAHARKHLPPPTQPLKAWALDLVFRLDCLSLSPSTWPPPARLFIDIKEKSIAGDLRLAGIRWTQKGNLTLAFHHNENFTAEKARSRASGDMEVHSTHA
ncbi:hypothetical protein DFH08DRAFT_1020605 [Mycena albidolilacea]|uniref:Uncharacterized protein n=1 Tax=Mycena albidolilacea TaxID=1033008 RepID=A0AAD7EM90_9AGAR|nr:hypothetical protein DFH08DRAFT_1020605 [Mycena albidolilacea]